MRNGNAARRTSTICSVARLFGWVAISASLFGGCGGGGDSGGGTSSPPASPTTQTGQLIDGRVKGVAFQSGSTTGLTDGSGTFEYESGRNITFCIGTIQGGSCQGIALGTTSGKSLIRPYDLSTTSTAAINKLRLLQALDADNNLNNGITISSQVAGAAAASNLSLDFSPSSFTLNSTATTILSTALGRTPILPSVSVADMHGSRAYACELTGLYRGTYTGGDRGEFQALFQPNGTILIRGRSTAEALTFKGAGSISTTSSSDTFLVGSIDTGATFSGKLVGSSISGTWSNSSFALSGSFTGQLQNVSAPSGATGDIYKATYAGDDFGSALLVIDKPQGATTGTITGQIYSGGDNVSGTLDGTVSSRNGIGGSFSLPGAPGSYTGQIYADSKSVFIDGTWNTGTSTNSASGTFSGCLLNTETQLLTSVPIISTVPSTTPFITSGSSSTTGGSGGTLSNAQVNRMITNLTTGGGCNLCW